MLLEFTLLTMALISGSVFMSLPGAKPTSARDSMTRNSSVRLVSGRFIDKVSLRNRGIGRCALAVTTDFLLDIENGTHCKPIWPARDQVVEEDRSSLCGADTPVRRF